MAQTPTSDSTVFKQVVQFLGLVVLIVCCGCCGFMFIGCYQPKGVSYDLRVEGDQLKLLDYNTGSQVVIFKGKPSPVHYDIYTDPSKVIVKGDDGKVAYRYISRNIQDVFWAGSSQVLYIFDNKDNGTLVVWKNGKATEASVPFNISQLYESADGHTIWGRTGTSYNFDHIVLISTSNFTINEANVNELPWNPIMADNQHFLVEQNGLHVIRISDGTSSPIAIQDELSTPVVFRNGIWAVRRRPGEVYDIVRISPDLTKINQVAQIPASFPKPIPPHREFSFD